MICVCVCFMVIGDRAWAIVDGSSVRETGRGRGESAQKMAGMICVPRGDHQQSTRGRKLK